MSESSEIPGRHKVIQVSKPVPEQPPLKVMEPHLQTEPGYWHNGDWFSPMPVQTEPADVLNHPSREIDRKIEATQSFLKEMQGKQSAVKDLERTQSSYVYAEQIAPAVMSLELVGEQVPKSSLIAEVPDLMAKNIQSVISEVRIKVAQAAKTKDILKLDFEKGEATKLLAGLYLAFPDRAEAIVAQLSFSTADCEALGFEQNSPLFLEVMKHYFQDNDIYHPDFLHIALQRAEKYGVNPIKLVREVALYTPGHFAGRFKDIFLGLAHKVDPNGDYSIEALAQAATPHIVDSFPSDFGIASPTQIAESGDLGSLPAEYYANLPVGTAQALFLKEDPSYYAQTRPFRRALIHHFQILSPGIKQMMGALWESTTYRGFPNPENPREALFIPNYDKALDDEGARLFDAGALADSDFIQGLLSQPDSTVVPPEVVPERNLDAYLKHIAGVIDGVHDVYPEVLKLVPTDTATWTKQDKGYYVWLVAKAAQAHVPEMLFADLNKGFAGDARLINAYWAKMSTFLGQRIQLARKYTHTSADESKITEVESKFIHLKS